MKTLIIYDSTGKEYMRISGENIEEPTGSIQSLIVNVPEGQILKGIDVSVTPNIPILEDIPKTEVESIQEQLLVTQAELANLKEQVLLNK